MRDLRTLAIAVSALATLVAPSPAFTQEITAEETPARVSSALELRRPTPPLPPPPPTDGTLRDVHLGLQIATLASFAATAAFGVIAAINQPTLLGEGECAQTDGDPVFGDEYGCTHLSILHGIIGVTTTTLYTASLVTGAMMPEQDDVPPLLYDVLTAIHVGGMLILPLLGILAAYPGVIGIADDEQADFSEALRSVHATIAFTAAAVYVTTVLIDWT